MHSPMTSAGPKTGRRIGKYIHRLISNLIRFTGSTAEGAVPVCNHGQAGTKLFFKNAHPAKGYTGNWHKFRRDVSDDLRTVVTHACEKIEYIHCPTK